MIADNLDLGRPHNVEIIFNRRIRRDTPGTFRTAIDRRDNGGVVVNIFYKHSRIKQYLKPGRACRYHVGAPAARTIAALLTLRDQVIAPILAAVRSPRMGRKPAD